MAKLALVQDNLDVKKMVRAVLEESGTKLSRVCTKHNIDYSATDKRLKSKVIHWDWLSDLIKKINPKAVIKVDLDISVKVDGKEVFNQKIEE